jgi:hypothetical protein
MDGPGEFMVWAWQDSGVAAGLTLTSRSLTVIRLSEGF